MKTRYFTFGYGQQSSINGIDLDTNTIVEVKANDPRLEMFKIFGSSWAFEYSSLQKISIPNVTRIININKLR